MARRRKYRRNPDAPAAGGILEKLAKAVQDAFSPPAAPQKAVLVKGASKLKALKRGGRVGLGVAAANIVDLRNRAAGAEAQADEMRKALNRMIAQGVAPISEIRDMQDSVARYEEVANKLSRELAKTMESLGAPGAVAAVIAGAPAKRGGRKGKTKGGKRRKGRGAYISKTKKGRISKASLKRLKRIAGSRATYVGKGKNRKMVIKMNPSVGGIVGLVSAAAGMGAGYVVATNVVPHLVGKAVPQAAQGIVGLAVGGLGGYALSRVIARYKPSLASQVYVGALAAVGAGLVAMVIKYLPGNVKAPLGLGRMNDYLQLSGGRGMADYMQLSGPVPESLFAGGLNGMNDYVDFKSRAAGQAAEAISAQLVEWTPTGNEGF